MKIFLNVSVPLLLLASFNISANPIIGDTCGVPDREATLSSAAQCAYGSGNPDATDIVSYWGDTWTNEGELTSDDTNKYLTASSDVGWGAIPNNGDWSIAADFWTIYDSAVITMHIGNGAGDPDHFAWLMDSNSTSGTWSVADITGGTGKGGGLSNLKLWGAGTASVPEPSIIALFGLGLLGLGFARRRKA